MPCRTYLCINFITYVAASQFALAFAIVGLSPHVATPSRKPTNSYSTSCQGNDQSSPEGGPTMLLSNRRRHSESCLRRRCCRTLRCPPPKHATGAITASQNFPQRANETCLSPKMHGCMDHLRARTGVSLPAWMPWPFASSCGHGCSNHLLVRAPLRTQSSCGPGCSSFRKRCQHAPNHREGMRGSQWAETTSPIGMPKNESMEQSHHPRCHILPPTLTPTTMRQLPRSEFRVGVASGCGDSFGLAGLNQHVQQMTQTLNLQSWFYKCIHGYWNFARHVAQLPANKGVTRAMSWSPHGVRVPGRPRDS